MDKQGVNSVLCSETEATKPAQTEASPTAINTILGNGFAINKWQQLSPIAILYFTASSIKQLLSSAIYLVPVLAINYQSILQHPFIWLPSLALFIGLLFILAFLNFRVFRFKLSDSHIEIRSGLISKKHVNLPYERVQNVKLEQPLYYRLSGHVCLQLDTAGSAKNEAKIIALNTKFAEQLKSHILDYRLHQNTAIASHVDETNNTVRTEHQEQTLNRRQLKDLIIHGITSNRIWIFLGGLAPFYDNIFKAINQRLQVWGIDFSTAFSLETHSLIEIGLFALSITMLVMLILVSFSVLGSIISFYGYTLNKLDDRYIRRSGLLTKHEVSMRISRLQMIVRKQDWLDIILNRINLKFEQNNSVQSGAAQNNTQNKIIVPSIKPDECQALIDDAYPDNSLDSIIKSQSFESISSYYLMKNIVFIWGPIWLLLLTISLLQSNYFYATACSAVFTLVCGLVYLSWKRWGIATDQQYIYIRKGLLGVDYYCFPKFKIQQTKFLQSVFCKRRHLASVHFVLASGSLTIPLIDQVLACRLIDNTLFNVESSKKSWM